MSHKKWAHGERMSHAATAYPNGLDRALNDLQAGFGCRILTGNTWNDMRRGVRLKMVVYGITSNMGIRK